MAKRPQLIDQQVVDASGKIKTVRVAAPDETSQIRSAAIGIPSAIKVSSAAGTGVSAEVADDLLMGIATHRGDLISVDFTFGPKSAPSLAADDADARLTGLLGDDIEIAGNVVTWNTTFNNDGDSLDLFDESARVADLFGLYDVMDNPDISFIVTSYVSALEHRISGMTPEQRKSLAESAGTNRNELEVLLRLSEPETVLLTLTHPRTPTALIARIAESGPPVLQADRRNRPARINSVIQRAAKTEMTRRARQAKGLKRSTGQ